MKKKLQLNDLKLKSFVTDLNQSKEQTIHGGKDPDGGKLTVITFGYWTWCCGVDTEANLC